MKTTTIQIYIEDREYLASLCNKGENFRDKLHSILKHIKEVKVKNGR